MHTSVENQASSIEIAPGEIDVIADDDHAARRVRLAVSRDAVDGERFDLVIGADGARVTVAVDAADSVVSIDRSMDGAARVLWPT